MVFFVEFSLSNSSKRTQRAFIQSGWNLEEFTSSSLSNLFSFQDEDGMVPLPFVPCLLYPTFCTLSIDDTTDNEKCGFTRRSVWGESNIWREFQCFQVCKVSIPVPYKSCTISTSKKSCAYCTCVLYMLKLCVAITISMLTLDHQDLWFLHDGTYFGYCIWSHDWHPKRRIWWANKSSKRSVSTDGRRAADI